MSCGEVHSWNLGDILADYIVVAVESMLAVFIGVVVWRHNFDYIYIETVAERA